MARQQTKKAPPLLARPAQVVTTPEPSTEEPSGQAEVATVPPEKAQQADRAQRHRVKNNERTKARHKKHREAVNRRGRKKYPPKTDPATGELAAGRPAFHLSEEDIEKVRACYGLGLTDEKVQIIMGIPRSTFYDHKDEFAKWREEGLAFSESGLMEAAHSNALRGSLGHLRFVMAKVHGYIEVQKQEISGPGGGPVEQVVAEGRLLSDDELLGRFRTLMNRAATMGGHVLTAAPIAIIPPPEAGVAEPAVAVAP